MRVERVGAREKVRGMRRIAWWAMVTALTACESTPALLQVELLPTVGSQAAVVIFATTGKGTVGTGDVELTTSAGTLADGTIALDGRGSAKTTLTCDAESGCSARWDPLPDGAEEESFPRGRAS